MKYAGSVERRRIGTGSKSDHDAVVLVTGGRTLVLRRRGGHAFQDSALDALVGRTLEFDGEVLDNVLHVTGWREA
jgi:hypothetical protein